MHGTRPRRALSHESTHTSHYSFWFMPMTVMHCTWAIPLYWGIFTTHPCILWRYIPTEWRHIGIIATGNAHHTVTAPHRFELHVSPRSISSIKQITMLDVMPQDNISNPTKYIHLNFFHTGYMNDKKESALVCAHWRRNTCQWYYWITLPASLTCPTISKLPFIQAISLPQ